MTGSAPAWQRAADQLEQFLRSELEHRGEIPLHSPEFTADDRANVDRCFTTGWVSSVGPDVDEFERLVASAAGVAHGVATVNGTTALQAGFVALGLRPGDAVICPALTFIGTANAICHAGGIPIFVDSDQETLGIDPSGLRSFLSTECTRCANGLVHTPSGATIAGIVVVDIFGHPVDMDPIEALAEEFELFVVEDAAESLGSEYRTKRCGGFGRLGVFSFNGNKIVTCGGGGALVTDDSELAARIKHLVTTARMPSDTPHDSFDHDYIGFNFRLPNLNATLGCSQIARLDQMVATKRALNEQYTQIFADIPDTNMFTERPWARSNYWLPALFLADEIAQKSFLEETNRCGIATRPCWRLIPDTAAFQPYPVSGGLSYARSIVERLVNLPGSPWLLEIA